MISRIGNTVPERTTGDEVEEAGRGARTPFHHLAHEWSRRSVSTRMFHDAHSIAMLFVRFTSAAFDAVVGVHAPAAQYAAIVADVDDAAAALVAEDR